MSTTRHHINRRRRLAALSTASVQVPAAPTTARDPEPDAEEAVLPARRTPQRPTPQRRTPQPRTPRPTRLLTTLSLLTLLLGAFAGWAHSNAQELRDEPARHSTALTDPVRTSELKGQTAKAVNALFSYDFAHSERTEKAVATHLTGKAVDQHQALLAGVLAQAQQHKTVLTTTVTDSAVERLDGDRARVLVYADQTSTSTAAKSEGEGAYAGAMLAVDLVHRDGRWLVSAIDTFRS